jgi:signal transduction histidine kinase
VRDALKILFGSGSRLTSAYATIIAISVGVFLVGFTITSVSARAVSTQNQIDYDGELAQDTLTIKTQLAERISSYNQLLYAASAQFTAKSDMTREDWRNFYTAMQVESQYPSVMAVGYAPYVPANQLESFVGTIREEGFSDFKVRVDTMDPTSSHAVIQYIEPFEGENMTAFGYDMFSDPTRRTAMTAARDQAKAVLSRPVKLVQEGDKSQTFGSLLYFPVYTTMTPPASAEERKANLKGYVYLAFRPLDIMSRIVNGTPKLSDNVDVALKSLSSGTGQTLFAAHYSKAAPASQTVVTKDVSVYGQTWRISVAGQDQAINQFYGPLGLFFLGAALSAFIALAVYYVLAVRLAKVERVFEEDVENTKSELLALASHQLRTPATGVKQYLGILRDGIMGQLTPAQQEIVDKAFATNERQLHVINDLLYVSKVETGQLLIDPVMTNVTKLTNEVIANLKSRADEKDINVLFRVTKPVVVTADDRYVSMIIENLISNAIKYSYPSSTVRVSLQLANGAMTLKVADKGVGLAREDVEAAFNKFNRVENPLSRQEGGSGLGLFLASQLAKGHGGSIEVAPTRGRGTTFVLTLPVVAMIDHEIVNLASQQKRGKRLSTAE